MHPLVRFGLLSGVRLMNAARLAAQSDSGGIDRPAPAPAGLFLLYRLRSYIRMVPDLDIFRSANFLVKQHDEAAPIHAAMRADAPRVYVP